MSLKLMIQSQTVNPSYHLWTNETLKYNNQALDQSYFLDFAIHWTLDNDSIEWNIIPSYNIGTVGNSYELTMCNNRFIFIVLSMLLNYRVLSQSEI
jgi:hypothetical protein